MTLYRARKEALQTVLHTDLCNLVLTYLDYSIPVHEVRVRKAKVMQALVYGEEYCYDNEDEVDNILNRLFQRTYFYKETDYMMWGHLEPYCTFKEYLSVNEILSLPTVESYMHPSSQGRRLYLQFRDQLKLRRALSRLRAEFKEHRDPLFFAFKYACRNKFVSTKWYYIHSENVQSMRRWINDWDYKRPYYIHERLEHLGLPLIDFQHQLERIDLHNDLTAHFMTLDTKTYIKLRGIQSVQRINTCTLVIEGRRRKYRERVVSHREGGYYHTKTYNRVAPNFHRVRRDYPVRIREVCVDRKWKSLNALH